MTLSVLKVGKGEPPVIMPQQQEPVAPKPVEEEKKASDGKDQHVDISSDECEELNDGTGSVVAAATIDKRDLVTPTKLPKKRSADDMAMTPEDGTVPTDHVTDKELASMQGGGSTNKKQKM